ncbi:unnamed protein product [Adineta steineri]|uniref:G-protein coupled receptors family 1 profile domain-containing protein n=1 Tax=Adineta steineri TaxID=433720 RepID=A0A815YPP5_9BILA|nr:unnamed protein product [Adineta steineri]CAF1573009.1 unnamed protein product [Adineta steineri]
MNTNNVTDSVSIECDLEDDLGYDLIPMYRILFILSCITVPLGIFLNIIFIITLIFLAKKIFDVNIHALLLSCIAQLPLSLIQGPIRLYFYYHNGCSPLAGTPLCQLTVYLDYIPTQINNFLVVQLSFERLLLVIKPFIFHRARHQTFSYATCLHYIGLFIAIAFPCVYYPTIMQNGASTIDLDDPSTTQTCDLWYDREIYELFDLLITFVPYALILIASLSVIAVILYRKYILVNRERRQIGSRSHRRLLFSLHLFLLWFILTWSPWVLYDFFQTVLNLTYSVYIDAITTYIVYLNYTFSSTIVLITFKEMRQFCFAKFRFGRSICSRVNHIDLTHTAGPRPTHRQLQTIGSTQTVHYGTRNHRRIHVA